MADNKKAPPPKKLIDQPNPPPDLTPSQLDAWWRARDKETRREEEKRGGAPTLDNSGRLFRRGGSVGSASRRADGIAQRGKTKGRIF
jgi:hypothetical protein